MSKHGIALTILLLPTTLTFGQQHHPEYVYVAPSSPGVPGFAVTRGTGVLTPVPAGADLQFYQSVATAPTGRFVFGESVQGLNVGAIDRATGTLTLVPGSPFETCGTSLAVTPDEHFLVVASGSSLCTYSIDGNVGAITPASLPVNSAADNVTVSPSGNFAYVGAADQYGPTPLMGYAITPKTGALTPLTLNAFGSAPVISADGKHLYSISANVSPGITAIYGYSVDTESGNLTAIPGSPFVAMPSVQLNLAIDPSGRFLYETVESQVGSAGALAGFLINPLNGAIEDVVPGSPFPITDVYPNGVVIDHSGKFVYTLDFGGERNQRVYP
jgi:6-phosphogluconolactonase (cycloisomerase 2 family)